LLPPSRISAAREECRQVPAAAAVRDHERQSARQPSGRASSDGAHTGGNGARQAGQTAISTDALPASPHGGEHSQFPRTGNACRVAGHVGPAKAQKAARKSLRLKVIRITTLESAAYTAFAQQQAINLIVYRILRRRLLRKKSRNTGTRILESVSPNC
jgi:hypothetical protein